MKITKEMVAKHIMNQSEISEPFDETKKCAMAFCYSEGSNIVFRDVWKEDEDSGIFCIMNPANGKHNSGQMEISFPVIGKSSL